ncbi:hypothetical protein VTN77DRAFT_1118 [Rasamsonia byssochlamydoides]|uniref:uncharacterized protein n=1 Tax=Rasamsonia byssochlamydoides TaxID=89139 RepID=UPI0037429FDE
MISSEKINSPPWPPHLLTLAYCAIIFSNFLSTLNSRSKALTKFAMRSSFLFLSATSASSFWMCIFCSRDLASRLPRISCTMPVFSSSESMRLSMSSSVRSLLSLFGGGSFGQPPTAGTPFVGPVVLPFGIARDVEGDGGGGVLTAVFSLRFAGSPLRELLGRFDGEEGAAEDGPAPLCGLVGPFDRTVNQMSARSSLYSCRRVGRDEHTCRSHVAGLDDVFEPSLYIVFRDCSCLTEEIQSRPSKLACLLPFFLALPRSFIV